MISKISLHRLNKAFSEKNRPTGKGVYRLSINGKKLVLTVYQGKREIAKKPYSRNVFHFSLLDKEGINPLRLIFYSDEDLIFLAEDGGERLDRSLRKCSSRAAQDKITQAVEIIVSWHRLNLAKQGFILPVPLEQFLKMEDSGHFQNLPKNLSEGLRRTHQTINRLIRKLGPKSYLYGYGRADGDIINFASKKGKVSTFDFDNTREFYDLYYVLAYLYVSLERVGEKKETLRKHLLAITDFGQKDAQTRFLLGALGAYLIEVCHQPQSVNVVQTRLQEIKALKATLSL